MIKKIIFLEKIQTLNLYNKQIVLLEKNLIQKNTDKIKKDIIKFLNNIIKII